MARDCLDGLVDGAAGHKVLYFLHHVLAEVVLRLVEPEANQTAVRSHEADGPVCHECCVVGLTPEDMGGVGGGDRGPLGVGRHAAVAREEVGYDIPGAVDAPPHDVVVLE